MHVEKRYKLKLIATKTQLGSKEVSSYKAAISEAEGWVLSGKNYTCIIEWSTLTGDKSLVLDYQTVQQQRKARSAYKKSLKKNLLRNTYVAI